MTKGVFTSEFALVVLYVIVVVLNGTIYVNIPDGQMLALGGLLGVYAGQRGAVKFAQVRSDPAAIEGLAGKIVEAAKK